jgi:hypothetical protein
MILLLRAVLMHSKEEYPLEHQHIMPEEYARSLWFVYLYHKDGSYTG